MTCKIPQEENWSPCLLKLSCQGQKRQIQCNYREIWFGTANWGEKSEHCIFNLQDIPCHQLNDRAVRDAFLRPFSSCWSWILGQILYMTLSLFSILIAISNTLIRILAGSKIRAVWPHLLSIYCFMMDVHERHSKANKPSVRTSWGSFKLKQNLIGTNSRSRISSLKSSDTQYMKSNPLSGIVFSYFMHVVLFSSSDTLVTQEHYHFYFSQQIMGHFSPLWACYFYGIVNQMIINFYPGLAIDPLSG